MLDLWDKALILCRDRCPGRSCSRRREWSRSNGVLFYGFEVKERPLVKLVRDRSPLSRHMLSPFARSALAAAASPYSVEDSPLSLSQSALPTRGFCGPSARRRRPAGTRNESTRLAQTLRLFGYLLGELPRSCLQERAAATGGPPVSSAEWLRLHPGVERISRGPMRPLRGGRTRRCDFQDANQRPVSDEQSVRGGRA